MAPKPVQGDAAVRIAARLLIAVLICSFIYLAKVVLIPCGLALLISFMLQPIVRRLRRWRLPRLLAVILTVLLFGSVLGGMSVLIGGQLAAFAAELPNYRAEMVSKITAARDALRGGTIAKLQTTFNSVAAEVKKDENAATPEKSKTEPMPVTIASPDKFLDMGGVSAIGPLLEPLATGGLVALLVVLMLLQWAELRSRLVAFLPGNVTGATQTVDDAAKRIGRYLGMQLLVNASFGLVAGLGFYFLGVRYAALWGLCAGLFRYVPYAGPVVGALLPLSVSLVTSQGWSQFLAVGALLLVMELINDNLVEPFVYGSSVGISEIGIILAAVAWTVLWGPAGLVLATPLTVCLVVLGEHVPALSFFARLLGDKPVLSAHYRFYERLLARDDVEAAEMVKRLATEDPEAAVAEVLVLPALAFARREQSLRRLSPAQAADVIERALRMVPPSTNGGSEAEGKPAAPPPKRGACCPMVSVSIRRRGAGLPRRPP